MHGIRAVEKGVDIGEHGRLGESGGGVGAEREIAQAPGKDLVGVVIGDEWPLCREEAKAGLGQRAAPPRAGARGHLAVHPPGETAAFLAQDLAQDSGSEAAPPHLGSDENVTPENDLEGRQDQRYSAAHEPPVEMGGEQVNGVGPRGMRLDHPAKDGRADALVRVEATAV